MRSVARRRSACDRARHLRKRQVGGHQRDPQPAVHQHHDRQRRAGPRGQILGVAGECEARLDERALLHRGRHHRGELPVHATIASSIEHFDDVGGIARIEQPCYHRLRRSADAVP